MRGEEEDKPLSPIQQTDRKLQGVTGHQSRDPETATAREEAVPRQENLDCV